MTSKDYVLIAMAIVGVRNEAREEGLPVEALLAMEQGLDRVTRRLAVELAADNDRFDHRLFLAACGV